MENKIGKMNFCIALFAIIASVVLIYTETIGIFESAQIEDSGLRVASLIFYVCGLFAVAGMLWVAVASILDASKGKQISANVPFYALAIFGMSMLVKYFTFMQAQNVWTNATMWVSVILGVGVLGASLFAILFKGKALNIMGFVISAVSIGYFGFRCAERLTAPVNYAMVFEFAVLVTLFVFTAIAYAKQLSKALPKIEEKTATMKKIEKK